MGDWRLKVGLDSAQRQTNDSDGMGWDGCTDYGGTRTRYLYGGRVGYGMVVSYHTTTSLAQSVGVKPWPLGFISRSSRGGEIFSRIACRETASTVDLFIHIFQYVSSISLRMTDGRSKCDSHPPTTSKQRITSSSCHKTSLLLGRSV